MAKYRWFNLFAQTGKVAWNSIKFDALLTKDERGEEKIFLYNAIKLYLLKYIYVNNKDYRHNITT